MLRKSTTGLGRAIKGTARGPGKKTTGQRSANTSRASTPTPPVTPVKNRTVGAAISTPTSTAAGSESTTPLAKTASSSTIATPQTTPAGKNATLTPSPASDFTSSFATAISRTLTGAFFVQEPQQTAASGIDYEFVSATPTEGSSSHRSRSVATPVVLRTQQAFCEAIPLIEAREFDRACVALAPHLEAAEKYCSWVLFQRMISNYGWCCYHAGHLEKAADAFTRAIHTHTMMNFDDCTVALRCQYALVLKDLGRLSQARDEYRVCIRMIENGTASPQQSSTGASPQAELDVCRVYLDYSRFLMADKKLNAAETMAQKAIDASGYVNTGHNSRRPDIFEAEERPAHGLNVPRKSAAVQLLEFSSDGDDVAIKRDRFRKSCVNLARVQKRRGNGSEAKRTYEIAIDVLRQEHEASVPTPSEQELNLPFDFFNDAEYIMFEYAMFLHHELNDPRGAMEFYDMAANNAFADIEKLKAPTAAALNAAEATAATTASTSTSTEIAVSVQDIINASEMEAKIMFNAALCIEKIASLPPQNNESFLSTEQSTMKALDEYMNGNTSLTKFMNESGFDAGVGSSSALLGNRKPNPTAAAASIIHQAIKKLVAVKKGNLTGRMRLHCARMLSAVDYVDRALEHYVEAVKLVIADETKVLPQIAANNKRAILHEGEARAHLAHCLHFRVGDYVGAEEQYKIAMASARKLTPVMAAFICDSYASMLAKQQRHEEATHVLLKRIDYGDIAGDYSVQSKIQLSHVYEGTQNFAEARHILESLIQLPQGVLTLAQQLDIICRLAYLLHYCINDYPAAAQMYEIALKLENANPHFLVQAAWCLSQNAMDADELDKVEKLYNTAIDVMETRKMIQGRPAPMTSQELLMADASGSTHQANHDAPPQSQAGVMTPDGVIYDELYVYGEIACFYHDKKKDPQTAETFYLQALTSPQHSENFGQVAANYALLLNYEKKDRDGAEKWFAKALQANPYNQTVNRLFADYLININQFDRCIEQLKNMVTAFPQDLSLYHRLAQIEERSATSWNVDDALLLYCKALGGPADATSWNDEMVLELMTNTRDEAVAVDAAVFIHQKARLIELAEKCYRILLKTFPRSMFLHLNFARLNVDHLSKPKLAQKHFIRAVDIQPNNPIAIDHLADFYASTQPTSLVAAEKLYLHSIQSNPADPSPHYHYACFLTTACPRPEAAERHFRKAIALGHTDPQVLCCYGAFLETQLESNGPNWDLRPQMIECIEKLYRQAVDAAPKIASHQVYLGSFLWKTRAMDEAWDCFQEALELEPNSLNVIRTVATFLHDWHAISSNGDQLAGNSAASNNNNKMKGATPGSHINHLSHRLGFTVLSAEQLDQVAKTAHNLFIQAIKIDNHDVVTLQNFARFLEGVMNDSAKAHEILDAIEKREQEALKERLAVEASRRGDNNTASASDGADEAEEDSSLFDDDVGGDDEGGAAGGAPADGNTPC